MRFIRKNIKIITIILIAILGICLIFLKIYLNSKEQEKVVENEEEIIEVNIIKEEETEEDKEVVFVDIKGEVVNPGVYEIEVNKKVIDVINLAGGLTDNADTTLINLAKKVANEMVVIVYTKEEVEKAKQEESIVKIVEGECICPEVKNDGCIENVKENNSNEASGSTKINLNTATIEELQTLDGIGESKAKAILSYREEKGKFDSIEDLLEVTGIGESLYEKIKDNITV